MKMLPDGTSWDESVTLTVMSGMSMYTPEALRNTPTGSPEPGPSDWTPKPQSPLDKRVQELMQSNLGMTLKEVMAYIQEREPELLPPEQRSEALNAQLKAKEVQDRLREAIDALRKEDRSLTFAQAYHQVVSEQPDLLNNMSTIINDSTD